MKVIVKIEIPSAEWVAWTGLAISKGFKREEARKRWTEKEVKEAAQFVVQKVVKETFEQYCKRGSGA